MPLIHLLPLVNKHAGGANGTGLLSIKQTLRHTVAIIIFSVIY